MAIDSPDDLPDDDIDDDPYQAPRRWVRGDEVATLIKHMSRVIPDSEWRAAVDGDSSASAPSQTPAQPPDPSVETKRRRLSQGPLSTAPRAVPHHSLSPNR